MKRIEITIIMMVLALVAFAVCGCESTKEYPKPFTEPVNDKNWTDWQKRFGSDYDSLLSYYLFQVDARSVDNDKKIGAVVQSNTERIMKLEEADNGLEQEP